MQGGTHPAQASRMESALMFARGRSADASEGINAARQKRAPKFPMRFSDAVLDGVHVTGPDLLAIPNV
jgi:hypothetical protein